MMERKTEDLESLFPLFPGKNTNFPRWVKRLAKNALRQYGNLARIFTTDQYYVPPELEIDADLDEVVEDQLTLRQRIERTVILQEAKERAAAIGRMKEDRPKLYAYIEQFMSKASEERVKAQDGYAEAFAEKDPLKLFRLIRATHIVEASGDAAADAQEARNHFSALRMQAYETVDDFKQRFDYAVEVLRATGHDYYTDAMQASEFVQKLDYRFSQLKADIDNGALAGIPKPANLLDAYTRAARYKVTVASKDDGYGFNTSFVSTADSVRGGRGGRGRGRGRGAKRSAPENSETEKRNSDDPQKKKKKKTCYFCKLEGHYVQDSPAIRKAGDGTTAVNVEDDRDDFNLNAVALNDQLREDVVLVGILDKLSPYDVFLDSGANKSMWKHKHLLEDVREECEVGTTGVDGGRLVTAEIGHLPGFFDISCSERAVANILSLSEVEDRFERVEYKKGQYYRVYVTEQYYIEFRRRYGVYIGNLREYLR